MSYPMCGQRVPDDALECPHCTATLQFPAPAPPVPGGGGPGPMEPVDHINDLAPRGAALVHHLWHSYRDAAIEEMIA